MSYSDDVREYIAGVLSGRIVTGRLERLAVHRHVDDLVKAEDRGYYFDERLASKAIAVSRLCNQYEGNEWAGKPLELRGEQKFIVWNLFGWRQKSDGLRRFRQAQIEIGRKGGKSCFVSYLSILLSLMDDPLEKGSQGYVAATKQDQAKIVWKCAKRMIEQSPALLKRSKITPSKLEIEFPEVDSIFRPIASDSKTVDGFNPHFVIKDEEHAWREEHRGLADTLASGFGARSQPITITITTYGDDQSIVWKENHDYAVRCLESVVSEEIIDDSWFAMICALDYPNEHPCFRCLGPSCPWCGGTGMIPPDEPYNEKVWRKANPGIGTGPSCTPKIERMRESALLAKQRRDKEPEFFQKNLNIIVSSRTRVILPEMWVKSRGELSGPEVVPIVSCGGFDLGRSNDFAAVAKVGAYSETDDDGDPFRRYEILTRTWTVEDRPQELQIPMIDDWVRMGHIEQSAGDSVDFMDVQSLILEWNRATAVRSWAYDNTFAQQMAQMLAAEGVEVFPFTQGAKYYTEPITEFLKLLGKTRVVHGVDVPLLTHNGCPCLAWQAGNLVTIKNARSEIMPDKSSKRNKIDAMVAILMAFSECLYHQKDSVQGYYLTNSLAIGGSLTSNAQEASRP